MSDLISRQAAIAAIEFDITYAKAINRGTGEVTQMFERENEALEDAVERVRQLPPIQPEIIRCKDCKHYESEYGYCDYYQWNMTGGDFCSKAEKREVTT